MKRFASVFLAGVVMTMAGVSTHAQATKPAPSPAGKWTMVLETPHGKISTGFDLKVEGRKVAGEFTSDPTGKMAVTGEFVEGRLTFKNADGALAFSGRMKDADTISGALSTEHGDLIGLATRVKK